MSSEKDVIPIAEYQYDYTKRDYLETEKPYKELWAIQNPFLRNQAVTQMEIHARSLGVRNFKSLWTAYEKSMKGATTQNEGYFNVTEFTDQPIELVCNQWIANDQGVSGPNQRGDKVPVCPHAILPVERLVNVDTGEEKLKLAFNKGFGWRTLIAEKSVTSSKQKIVQLASRGIAVNSETSGMMVRYLADLENTNIKFIPERRSVGRLGYISGYGFSPYVKDLEFDGEASFRHLFKAVQSHGLATTWLDIAQRLRRESDVAKILLAASFASVLVEPVGALPFFVHIWGIDSGTGKTVGLMLAASVWGNPAVGEYIQTFNGTVVGHEKTAAFLNNLPLILDELQLSRDGRGNLNFDVYKLAQGVGRTRGNRSGGVDMTPRWANCIITSGESPIVDQHAGAGAVNRVISIEVEAANPIITAETGNVTATTLRRNYGFAGVTFAQNLYSDETTLDYVRGRVGQVMQELLQGPTTEKQAASAALLIVADELACSWIYDDGEKPLTAAVLSRYLATRDSVSAGKRGYEWLCDWVAQNASRFDPTFSAGEIYGLLDGNMAYIIRTVFERAAKEAGFSPKSLLSYLRSAKLIIPGRGRIAHPKKIGKITANCIYLKLPSEWYEDDSEPVEPLI